jgi:uncharacterized repeat protein (TIGR01451 family)
MATPSARAAEIAAPAAPIPPPEGYPKLSISTKVVTPALANTGGATLQYQVEIRNTGAYQADSVTFVDAVPANTTYNNDASASAGAAPTFSGGKVQWTGNVGFDSTVVIQFSVDTAAAFSGSILNTAVISHPMIMKPVSVTAETVVTDNPILEITKHAEPAKPAANQPMTYTLTVTNKGQPGANLPLTVEDKAPANTTIDSLGTDGSKTGNQVTWTRPVTLGVGESSIFSYTVIVGDVPSGTVITNDDYKVSAPALGTANGEVYTTTVLDPILLLWKTYWPTPPGSNRELTYTLYVYNQGAKATNLEITDKVPVDTTYVRGGTLLPGGVVQWMLPSLDSLEVAQVTYTVYIDDIAEVPILNEDYSACSGDGVCVAGDVITSVVGGPLFELSASLNPIAKKPGGGGGPVTPTLVLHNLGPGNAIDAHALLMFERISVQAGDLYVTPTVGTAVPFPDGPDCGDKCVSYLWQGSLAAGEMVTFTTIEGQSTIGGEEGTLYTATIIVSDTLDNMSTAPISATATGKVTHYANLIPIKSAPEVIGAGQLMTYSIRVWNSGLNTDEPPFPTLTETLPASVTLVSISDSGVSQVVSDSTVISWTLPSIGSGNSEYRSFTVLVDKDLVSGTQIVNDNYRTTWYESELGTVLSKTGEAAVTLVVDAGLVDSYKDVYPTYALPGPDNVFTYYLHIVNSNAVPLVGVEVNDVLPWQHSTYQRDAVASAGTVVSDIVSIQWTGNVGAYASEVVTFSVVADDDFEGTLTNTAVITHPDLKDPVEIQALAYVTTKPVLQITKMATPNPVERGKMLKYTIRVTNLGPQATGLVISDTLPMNTEYVPNSASAGVQVLNGHLQWNLPVLDTGASAIFEFQVVVNSGSEVINEHYMVYCAEGVYAVGAPVITKVAGGTGNLYLPVIYK